MKNKQIAILLLASFFMGAMGIWFGGQFGQSAMADKLRLDDQEATVQAIKKAMPSVVSIVVYEDQLVSSKDLITGTITQKKITQEQGSGSGFIISSDGLIITNKHVVKTDAAANSSYRIITSTGKKYYAQLIGVDPINDLAVLKIFDKGLPYLEMGDSDSLASGYTVIAIGNTLGKYQNSVTKGIVSGIGRTLSASDGQGKVETLDNVIQTDAEINFGNSGGPLIDLTGRVVGINVAVDTAGSAIGFAIPINDAKPVIKSVREIGRIVRPKLGVQYMTITPEIAAERNLSKDSGALVIGSDGVSAVAKDGPAEKAGVKEGDIIYEVDGIKLTEKKTLLSLIQGYRPGKKVGLKIWRNKAPITLIVVLEEFK